MSEDNRNENEASINTESEEFVSKKAYGEVSTSMHKFKGQLKDTQAELNQLRAEKEAQENERMAEQGKWEDLYNKGQSELEALRQSNQAESAKFIDYHKKNAVLSQTEGFKRDEYNKFINVDSIQMDENGSIDQESLQAEVDRIKQEYPELLKSSSVRTPSSDAPNNELGNLDPSELTPAQKDEYFKQMLKNK